MYRDGTMRDEVIEQDLVEKTRRAFDTAAPVYDETYEHLHGIRRLRALTTKVFLRYFEPGDTVLELNCGTGTDAVTLGRHGVHVLATDLSPGMIAETRRKIASAGLEGVVRADVLPFASLETLHGSEFDGAYSNLGGLNCADDLDAVAAGLAPLIKHGRFFIATVMPRLCAWEALAFLSRGNVKGAFRRMNRRGCSARLHGGIVQTYYHSPRGFMRAFSAYFEPVELLGLNVFTPPPNSGRAHAILSGVLPILERVDDFVASLPPFTSVGDHYCAVLRRKPS